MTRQQFTLELDLGNEAFDSPSKRIDEVSRIMRETADRIEGGIGNGYVYDVNGNKVGQWALDEVEEPDDDDEEEETPLDTPSLDTSFHDHEMNVDDRSSFGENGS